MKKFIGCKSRSTAKRRCLWAAVITKCCGGFMAFEFVTDYVMWGNQK